MLWSWLYSLGLGREGLACRTEENSFPLLVYILSSFPAGSWLGDLGREMEGALGTLWGSE